MFEKSIDDRLSAWADHRRYLTQCSDPLQEVHNFWRDAPFVPFNNKIDPYNKKSWPTPWEIIVSNRFDDFTKAVMIGWTLKLTDRFKNSKIEIKTLVNPTKKCYYNIVCVDDTWVINYNDNGPIPADDIPDSFYLENQVELSSRW